MKKIPSPDKSALQKTLSGTGDGKSVKSDRCIFTVTTVTRQQFQPNFSRAMTVLGRELNSVVRQFVSVLDQISCQPVYNLTSEILLRATVNELLDFDDDGTAMCLMTMMNNIVDELR